MNTALMHFRKKALRQVSLDERADAPKEKIDLCQDDGRLRGTVDRIALIRAIGELPQGYRSIFLLHDVEGYGHQEIARLLHCSVGNSKSQLHKARLKIRESLLAKARVPEPAPALEPAVTRVIRTPRVSEAPVEEHRGRAKVLSIGNFLNKEAVA